MLLALGDFLRGQSDVPCRVYELTSGCKAKITGRLILFSLLERDTNRALPSL